MCCSQPPYIVKTTVIWMGICFHSWYLKILLLLRYHFWNRMAPMTSICFTRLQVLQREVLILCVPITLHSMGQGKFIGSGMTSRPVMSSSNDDVSNLDHVTKIQWCFQCRQDYGCSVLPINRFGEVIEGQNIWSYFLSTFFFSKV